MAVQDKHKLKASAAALDDTNTPHWQLHRLRKRAILAEFPQVSKLYGTDNRTQWYAYALIALQAWLAWLASGSYTRALALSVLIGPFVGNGILCLIHEATHFLVFQKASHNRILALLTNSVMVIPIAEIFRQHHHRHHQRLGDDSGDVDVPTPAEIKFVGNSALRKALWLAFNMIILPIRSLSRLPVEVDAFIIANWVVCIGVGAFTLFTSRPAFVFLILSTLNSQGLHPANTRQVQRHVYDGDAAMRDAPPGTLRPGTYSYYGPVNLLTLNVGYHIEHHDFCAIPWTRVQELRRIAGDKWYPDTNAHRGRGVRELFNFVTNKKITLADFAHEH